MTQPKQPPRAGFSDVDAEQNPQGYVRMLDLQHADPFQQQLKVSCRELLALHEAERWIAAVEQSAREGAFFAALTYFITIARKPDE